MLKFLLNSMSSFSLLLFSYNLGFAQSSLENTRGYHTRGSQILGPSNEAIQLHSVNWTGFQTYRFAPIGLYAENINVLFRRIKNSGFNSIRVPLSMDFITGKGSIKDINYRLNPGLLGLTPYQLLGTFISRARKMGLKIVLGVHCREAIDGNAHISRNGLWYGEKYSELSWVRALARLSRWSRNHNNVIAIDLFNEPHSTNSHRVYWGGGGKNDWRRAATRGAQVVLANNSRILVVVGGISGGISGYPGDHVSWWGQNLRGVRKRPVVPQVNGQIYRNKIVYSPHVYPKAILGKDHPIFQQENYPYNMRRHWDQMFGYIHKQNIAPIWIGEFAANFTGKGIKHGHEESCSWDSSEMTWMRVLRNYIYHSNNVYNANVTNRMSWSYWANGYDRCGRYLHKDVMFKALDTFKIKFLKTMMQ